MKAITYAEHGSADNLTLTDVPEPHPGPDTVVIKVKAAGINPVDYKIREGRLQGLIDTHLPAIPGWDVAGVVIKTGLDTPEIQVGDEVYAYARKEPVAGGTLAEQVAVPLPALALKPSSVSFVEAAAVPLAGLTALQTLRRAGVSAGDRVLIHGASGGVGAFGVQIARHFGATVVGTASAKNHDFLRSLGAEPIEYGDGLAERAAALAPAGYDRIIDFAGGDSLDSAAALLAANGVAASITSSRARDELGGHYVWVRPNADDLRELASLIDAGHVRVEIAATYPLERAADAFRELETGHTRGKIVITVD